MEILQQLVDIVDVALGHIEFARRYVQEADTVHFIVEMQTAKKVVLLHLKHHIVVRHARRDQLRYTPLHQPFGCLGVFQLLTYSHSLPCPHQSRKVLLQCVIRKARHLGVGLAAVRLACQSDAQYAGTLDGVTAIGLIEVADAEKQHCVRKLLFHLQILPHQRGILVCLARFVCHCISVLKCKITQKKALRTPHIQK